MRILLIFGIGITFLLTACSNQKDVETFSEGMCQCAEPIINWTSMFNKNPMAFENGRAVRAEVDSCLNGYLSLYNKYSDDADFMEDVKQYVRDNCPKATGSVAPMLEMLGDKK